MPTDDPRLDSGLRADYLRRLGLDAEPPSIEALQRLHRRHVEVVPYETMWLHAGDGWGIDPVDSVQRIAREARGGYCYHLNGAFSALLHALGYRVTRHVGGVHGPEGPGREPLGDHLALSVRDLPTDENPTGTWYVDVGLGDALHEALPLVAGEYVQPPFRLALRETVVDEPGPEDGDWHLAHDPNGGFVGMSWTAAAADMTDFAAKHEWLSTAPESSFRRVAIAQHRDATGVDVIRGLVPIRVGETTTSSEPITERADWFDALAEMFGLRFDGRAPETLDRLWDRVLATHRAWEAAGRT